MGVYQSFRGILTKHIYIKLLHEDPVLSSYIAYHAAALNLFLHLDKQVYEDQIEMCNLWRLKDCITTQDPF